MNKELGLVISENVSAFSDELHLVESHCFRLFPFFLLIDINLLLYLDKYQGSKSRYGTEA